MQPFLVPNEIAYPTRVTEDELGHESYRVLFDPNSPSEDQAIQERFDNWSRPVIKDIVNDLRCRKAYLIDDRAIESIKTGNVGYKVFDDDKKCL